MHYMHSLTTYYNLPFVDAIQCFGNFSQLLDDLFCVHCGSILARVQSVEGKGGCFGRDLHIFCSFLRERDVAESPRNLCWTVLSVVYTVRRNIIVDVLRHTNTLQRGRVTFRYNCDGSCDWAIKEHNFIYHWSSMDRYNKYASRQNFELLQLP